jgi:hypothetical protein
MPVTNLASSAKLTLVFYFVHNLDASLAAKSLQSAILQAEGGSDCRLFPMNLATPDITIADTVKTVEGVTDVCVLGYCPEDFTTLDLAETFPDLGISYFLYENNIQFGAKLVRELEKKGMAQRVKVYKPNMFRVESMLNCGDSMCGMMLQMIGHGMSVNYGLGCRSAMAAVDRWYTRDETSIKDLNVAWAIRYDAEVRDGFAGSETDLTEVVTGQ